MELLSSNPQSIPTGAQFPPDHIQELLTVQGLRVIVNVKKNK